MSYKVFEISKWMIYSAILVTKIGEVKAEKLNKVKTHIVHSIGSWSKLLYFRRANLFSNGLDKS